MLITKVEAMQTETGLLPMPFSLLSLKKGTPKRRKSPPPKRIRLPIISHEPVKKVSSWKSHM